MSLSDKSLIDQFQHVVNIAIDEDGIFPFPGISKRKGKTHIAAITDSELAFKWFWDEIGINQTEECIFGLDRTTKENQGTGLGVVLTCAHWREGMGDHWYNSFRIGVIEYQHEPRIVTEIDFENEYWLKQMTDEVISRRPPFRMKLEKKPDANF